MEESNENHKATQQRRTGATPADASAGPPSAHVPLIIHGLGDICRLAPYAGCMLRKETHLIRVSREAKQVVVREARARGMGQKELTSRIMEWFHKQPYGMRSLVLGQTDPNS